MPSKTTNGPVRMLLLWGDRYGANCTVGGRKLPILEKFRRYGWELTLAGAEAVVQPCAFAKGRGAEPVDLDCTIDALEDIAAFDGISVMPGPSHKGLIDSPRAMAIVRQAFEAGLVVSAWCRGVRVLAAADVLHGKRVVCHADDRDVIEAAGGFFVGHDHPPVIDETVVTGARSYYYRTKNADAIRDAMTARLGRI